MNPDVELVQRICQGQVPLPQPVLTSPMARALGMEIHALDAVSGEAVIGFVPAETFLQGAGVLQGGAVAGMLDFAIMMPVMATMPAGAMPASTNLDVAYFRPALCAPHTAHARLRRQTRSLVFAEAILRDAQGAEIASATSTIFLKHPK